MSLRSRLRRARPPLRPLRSCTDTGLPCRVPKDAPPAAQMPEATRAALCRSVDMDSPAFVVARAAGLARRGMALRGTAVDDDDSPVPGNGTGALGEVAVVSVGPEARRLERLALPAAPPDRNPTPFSAAPSGRELMAATADPPDPADLPPTPALFSAPGAADVDGPWTAAAGRVRDQLTCPRCSEAGHVEELDLVTGRVVMSCATCGAGWDRPGALEGASVDRNAAERG